MNTLEEIRNLVQQLADNHGNAESAHVLEDQIHDKALVAIAEGAEHADEIAEEAMKTVTIDFERWYA